MTSKKNDSHYSEIAFDFETAGLGQALSQDMLEAAAAKASSGAGKSSVIYMGSPFIISNMGWSQHPEYNGTPWAYRDRLTKREHAFAKLHTFLYKFKVLKNLSEDDHEQIKNISIKRLKRAKWARNSGPKPSAK